MTTREEFEAWLTGGKPSAATERKADYEGLCGWDEYRSTHTAAMWSAWQAARAAALEEAAKECEKAVREYGGHSNFICAKMIRALKD